MQLSILHKTHYSFDETPFYGLQQLRLTPKSRPGHNVPSWNLRLAGGCVEAEFVDFNNNHTHLIRLDDEAKSLTIVSEGVVDNTLSSGVLGEHEGFAPLWYFNRETPLTKAGKGVAKLLNAAEFDARNTLDSLHALSSIIIDAVNYVPGQTGVTSSAESSISLGKGVCQDHAHIFIACARSLGLPARYISGYLMMDDRIDQTATHAWAEIWIEDLGWVGFDVSNQVSPDEKYVRLASGLDYREAAPISGIIYGDAIETVNTELRVQQQ